MTTATLRLDGSRIDASLIGGKGFALNRLIGMSAPVPATGSITTAGYRWFVKDSGLERFIDQLQRDGLPEQADLDRAAERIDTAFLEARMPDALADEIRRLGNDLGEGNLLAVRSSATAEDLADASFAGP